MGADASICVTTVRPVPGGQVTPGVWGGCQLCGCGCVCVCGGGACFTLKPRTVPVVKRLGGPSHLCVAVSVHPSYPERQPFLQPSSRWETSSLVFSLGMLLASCSLPNGVCTAIKYIFCTLASLILWGPWDHRPGMGCQLLVLLVEENQNVRMCT